MLKLLSVLASALDAIKQYFVELEGAKKRLIVLETLLKGVIRIVAPDGTEGLYFPFRIGIQTEYFLHQPAGHGAGLCVSTAVDPYAAYIQHDGDQVPDPKNKVAQRIALMVRNTDFNADGVNTGIDVVASNAPHGNIGLHAMAQYSPNADTKLTIVKEEEWKN